MGCFDLLLANWHTGWSLPVVVQFENQREGGRGFGLILSFTGYPQNFRILALVSGDATIPSCIFFRVSAEQEDFFDAAPRLTKSSSVCRVVI
jgi:hypothetical protein